MQSTDYFNKLRIIIIIVSLCLRYSKEALLFITLSNYRTVPTPS